MCAVCQQHDHHGLCPFVPADLTCRSTFPGAGPYTGHWTGDTKTSWGSLQQATAGILSSNMWGLAMTGADICGYGIEGKATTLTVKQQEELCVR